MNASWSKLLKSAYRKEQISSFVVIVGAVDAVIGGVDQRWSLLTVGLGTVGVAIALRWWLVQRSQDEPLPQAPIRYLPAQSSRPALPTLSAESRNRPR